MLSVSTDKVNVDAREVYRYLGYRQSLPDPSVAERVEECIRQIQEASQLRYYCRRFPIEIDSSKESIKIEGVTFVSGDLIRHLKGCVEAFVFGATIGVGADRLIARSGVNNMMEAAMFQAAGAAYIEAYCDEIDLRIKEMIKNEGREARARFSPGYGDFVLDDQRKLFDLLDLTKHTGISLTDGMLMMPSKSVTAIIGVTCEAAASDERGKGNGMPDHDCSSCSLSDCQFRRT